MDGRNLAAFIDSQLPGINMTKLYNASKTEEQRAAQLGEVEKKRFNNLLERMIKIKK